MLKLDVTGRVEWSGGQTWAPARLMVDQQGRAGVWLSRPHGGAAELAWSGRLTATDGGGWEATDGTTLTAVAEGCGCGNRLSALGEMDLAALGIPA